MTKLVQVHNIGNDSSFLTCVIEDDGTTWIRLKSVTFPGIGAYWSQKKDTEIPLTADAVISELDQRLRSVELAKGPIFKVITYWPMGWNFWGASTPSPIADFVTYGEFERQLIEFDK